MRENRGTVHEFQTQLVFEHHKLSFDFKPQSIVPPFDELGTSSSSFILCFAVKYLPFCVVQ